MNKEDYSKYYVQGSDHYLIPKDVFDELNKQLEIAKLERSTCGFCPYYTKNKELNKQIEELEFIIGLRQKRNLISKFDKEYDEEDKKKNPNRDYAGIMPDAEEVYKRYYSMKKQQKEFIDYMNKTIEELECDDEDDEEMKSYLIQRIDTFKEILAKYKSITGGRDGNLLLRSKEKTKFIQ